MKKIFSSVELEFLKNNYDKMQYKDIAQYLGKTERQVRGKINGMGLSKLRKFDKSFFNCIDTPEKAYWLGFIFADGWVVCNETDRTYELGIELQEQDSYILESLVAAIKGNHKIVHTHHHRIFNGYEYDTSTARLRIYSKEIVRGLMSNGVSTNKTISPDFPKVELYMRDFVRGFLDGDGCITQSNRGHIVVTFTNSNLEFLSYLRDAIYNCCDAHGSIYSENPKKHSLRFFRVADTQRLLSWIYYDENLLTLKRKEEKYRALSGLAV